jgi:hypothetical protein
MSKKQIWYVVLTVMPFYGAYNSIQQFHEAWTWFTAGGEGVQGQVA